ncbi:MAG: recombination protein RecR [Verrucomicrobiales bacterium]|nr:recombination protein RecR [Verrucomicrobiales bacterium]
MAALDYPPPIQRLILQLKGLPGIGPRSAERLVIWLMEQGGGRSEPLAGALLALTREVATCAECGFFTEVNAGCPLCEGSQRERRVICVVEHAADVLRLERSGAFRGLYHVLGGKLSPLDNVTPEDLRIEPLLARLGRGETEELILAVGSDVEGEATAGYLADLTRPSGVRVTRLAQGMPAGGALDHVDELTLYRALQGRHTMG